MQTFRPVSFQCTYKKIMRLSTLLQTDFVHNDDNVGRLIAVLVYSSFNFVSNIVTENYKIVFTVAKLKLFFVLNHFFVMMVQEFLVYHMHCTHFLCPASELTTSLHQTIHNNRLCFHHRNTYPQHIRYHKNFLF